MKGIRTNLSTPYVFTVTPRVCACVLEPVAHKTGRTLDAVIPTAEAFWCAYLGFYGELVGGLEFVITDIRDGVVWWRNGHRIKGVTSGTFDQSEDQPAGRETPVGGRRRQWPRPGGHHGRADHG